jgi:hypothetical protein
MSYLPEKRDPTHTLTISVPLNLDANPAAESWDIQEAFREAITAILPIVSLGTLGLRCGDVVVALEETDCSSHEREVA